MYYPHHHHSTRQYDHLFVQQPRGIAQNAASMSVMHTQMKILQDYNCWLQSGIGAELGHESEPDSIC
jgi:hypothetical protein